MKNFGKLLLNISKYIYLIVLVIAILSATIGIYFFKHINLQEFTNFNFIYLLVGFVLCILISVLLLKISKRSVNYKKFLIIASVILLICQILIFAGKLFVCGWDVWYLFYKAPNTDHYFSMYPNNLFLHEIFAICSGFIHNFITDENPSAESVVYVIAVIAGILMTFASVIMVSLICKRLKGDSAGVISFVVAAIFIGLMPWILVPYSDIFALFFTTLLLYSYTCIKKSQVKWGLISFSTIIGFNIKPTVISAFLAFIFVELCFIHKLKQKNKNLYISTFITIVLVFSLSLAAVQGIKSNTKIDIDRNSEYTSTHFLMMGLNTKYQGLWNQEDLNISESVGTVSKREELNIETIKDRIEQMGPFGIASLMLLKTQENYGDATFNWGLDSGPNFVQKQIFELPIITYIYNHYQPFVSCLWFMILIGCCFIVIKPRNTKNQNLNINFCENGSLNLSTLSIKTEYAICTALLMQTIFLALFECGARYLILYTPWFVVLAILGINKLSQIINNNKFEKLKNI